jgi:hypothetical protein
MSEQDDKDWLWHIAEEDLQRQQWREIFADISDPAAPAGSPGKVQIPDIVWHGSASSRQEISDRYIQARYPAAFAKMYPDGRPGRPVPQQPTPAPPKPVAATPPVSVVPPTAALARPDKPPVSEAHLHAWYIKRVDTWPKDHRHPSSEEDEIAATTHFVGKVVTRKQVRSMRSQHAPAEWTKHGRRKLAD